MRWIGAAKQQYPLRYCNEDEQQGAQKAPFRAGPLYFDLVMQKEEGRQMNFLALDVGTTACKCQLFSERGEILFYTAEEYPLIEREGERYVDIEGIVRRVFSMMRAAAIASFTARRIAESSSPIPENRMPRISQKALR